MFRSGVRAALRSSQSSLAPARTIAGRRFLTTEPPHLRSRSWKSSALRWGLAAGGIYYYNTSPIFAEYPQNNLLNPNVDALDDGGNHPTLDQLTASSRNKAQKDPSTLQTTLERSSQEAAEQKHQNEQTAVQSPSPSPSEAPVAEGAADLEQEAEGEGAFNPVTGEINWDCPCLGGMAYGPCGAEFREAFSCFVYSNEEPKGMDCVDKFQNMQTCFRAHPEVYKGELEDDESLDGELAQEREDLQKEIAERRAAVEAQGQAGGRRLLEDSSATPVAATSGKTAETDKAVKDQKQHDKQTSQKQSSIKQSSTQSRSQASPQPEKKTKSHTPDEYPQKSESRHGAPSRMISDRRAPQTSVDAVPESESLVPKAAHDATDTSSSNSTSIAR